MTKSPDSLIICHGLSDRIHLNSDLQKLNTRLELSRLKKLQYIDYDPICNISDSFNNRLTASLYGRDGKPVSAGPDTALALCDRTKVPQKGCQMSYLTTAICDNVQF